MNNVIEAKYFDGKSSSSQNITIIFNERMNGIRLQFADGSSFVWRLDDLQFEHYGNLAEIRNKNYPGAGLKIDNKDFIQKYYNVMKQNKRIDIHTRLLKLGFSKITLIAVCLFCLLVLSYFYILPPIAERSAALLPESFDNYMGNVFMKTFVQENDIDSTKSKYLEQFASGLNLKNKKKLHFAVVKSKEVNAFALPNGQVVVYSAILDDMDSPDELAALLSHEVSHVNNRHSIKMLCRNLSGYMLVSLLFSDVNGIIAVLADNAQQLHALSYSRKFEREADEQGLKILMDNNIDPNGMVKLFEHLEKENKISVPEIISTHPLTKERKADIKQIISKSAYKIQSKQNLASIFEEIKK